MRTGRCLLYALTALLIALAAVPAEAAEIRIIASPSVAGVLKELGPRFESTTGDRLDISYGLVAAQKQQIEAGKFDLAITPSEVIDDEIKGGKIRPETRTPLARTGLGIGVRAGTSKPDVATIEAFRQTLLDANFVCFTANEESGRQISKDFDRLGIGEALKTKIKSQDSVAGVWKTVASGEAELGFGFITNILTAPGVELAGSFPPELQVYTSLAVGIGVAAQQADAAKTFVKYLIGPDAAGIIRRNGFEPATQ